MPPPPMLGGMPAAPARPSRPKCPKKDPKNKPAKKMKPLHWSKLSNEAAYETIWKELGKDDDVLLNSVDLILFEQQFCVEKRNKKKKAASSKPKVEKKKLVELVDSKRRQQVDICLKGLKLEADRVKQALLAMDSKVLDLEKLSLLVNCCPNAAELGMLKNYSGATVDLAPAERFMRVISVVPNLKTRISFWAFKEGFQEQVEQVEAGLKTVNSALAAIQESPNFKKVLRVVLAIGNYINGGTKKGGAWGFKLSSFGKLKMLRANDGKHNLMHFVAETVRERFGEALAFRDDLVDVVEGSRKDTAWLAGEASKLQGVTRRLENEVKKKNFASNDRFVSVMEPFQTSAKAKAETLAKAAKTMTKRTKELCKSFGEKLCRPEELLRHFAGFIRDFNAAVQAMDKDKSDAEEKAKRDARAKEFEARKKKAAAEKKRRQAEEKALKAGGGQTSHKGKRKVRRARENDLVDAVVADISKFSARDMLRRVRKKRFNTLKRLKEQSKVKSKART